MFMDQRGAGMLVNPVNLVIINLIILFNHLRTEELARAVILSFNIFYRGQPIVMSQRALVPR